jgi:hypothetical protein
MAIKIPPIIRVQEASDTPFDNTSNGFTADNVQDAIVEAQYDPPEYLREVEMVMYPFGPVDVKSNLLFDPDPQNDKINFLTEEII